ncbi:hypothetical protein EII17_09465 [Clostridiales bacterium COT073_COT-073]|nr:hypothetical protein EII17_09465 [Clostridiales bacterium COT073_COT-073]
MGIRGSQSIPEESKLSTEKGGITIKRTWIIIGIVLGVVLILVLFYFIAQFFTWKRTYRRVEQYLEEKYLQKFHCFTDFGRPKDYAKAGPFGGVAYYEVYVSPVESPENLFICLIDKEKEPYLDYYVESTLAHSILPEIKAKIAEQIQSFQVDVGIESWNILEDEYITRGGKELTFSKVWEIYEQNPGISPLHTEIVVIVPKEEIIDFPELLKAAMNLLKEKSFGIKIELTLLVMSGQEYQNFGFQKAIIPPGQVLWLGENAWAYRDREWITFMVSNKDDFSGEEFKEYLQETIEKYESSNEKAE